MSEAPESGYVIGKHTDKLLMGILGGLIFWAGSTLEDLTKSNAGIEKTLIGLEHRIGRTEGRLDWIERSGRFGPERPAPR